MGDTLENIILDEDTRVVDTFQSTVEPRVLQLCKRKLVFWSIGTGRKSQFAPGSEYAFHRAVSLADGSVFITGASGQEYKRHACMLYTTSLQSLSESEQGISNISLAVCGRQVFLLGKWCEVYDLDTREITRIEEPLNAHLSGGTCAYNGNVLLVGGIHCQTAELFNKDERHWIEVASFKEKMYNIACIQVKPHEVLIFGGGDRSSWLLDVERGTLTRTGDLPQSVSDSTVIENVPILHQGTVFCYVGEVTQLTLVKYSVETATWYEVARAGSPGCCILS